MQNDRGAIIIQVAFALLALLAFCTFVVDQGIMWTARRQAQNAADAGALAGAISLMHDMGDSAGAEAAARHYGHVNQVWGQNTPQADLIVPTPPIPCPDGSPACVRVDVFRGQPDRANTTHTNYLPTFFGPLVGVNQQGVRATATAWVGAGNLVNCIRPWVVVDKWVDNSGTGTNTSGWDIEDEFNPGVDTYTKPGFRADTDVGVRMVLKGEQNEYSSGWSLRIELGGGPGANVYNQEILGCPPWVKPIGLYDGSVPCSRRNPDQWEEKGCIGVEPGVAQGPTIQNGVEVLMEMDPDATWNETTNKVDNGCTAAGDCLEHNPLGIDISPRIIALTLFDPQACFTTSCQSGNNTVAQVVNIFGFFVEGTCETVYGQNAPEWCGKQPNKTVVGRMMAYPGRASGTSGAAGPETFLKMVQLIR